MEGDQSTKFRYSQQYLIHVCISRASEEVTQSFRNVLTQECEGQIRTIGAHHRQHSQNSDECASADYWR